MTIKLKIFCNPFQAIRECSAGQNGVPSEGAVEGAATAQLAAQEWRLRLGCSGQVRHEEDWEVGFMDQNYFWSTDQNYSQAQFDDLCSAAGKGRRRLQLRCQPREWLKCRMKMKRVFRLLFCNEVLFNNSNKFIEYYQNSHRQCSHIFFTCKRVIIIRVQQWNIRPVYYCT